MILTDLISTQGFSRKRNYRKTGSFSFWGSLSPFGGGQWWNSHVSLVAGRSLHNFILLSEGCCVKDSWIILRHTRGSQNLLFPWLYFVLFLLSTQVHYFVWGGGDSILNSLHDYPRNTFYWNQINVIRTKHDYSCRRHLLIFTKLLSWLGCFY